MLIENEKKILVVDDNRLSLEIARSNLEQAGYEVATAGDGNEGLEKLQKEKPDLVILDLVLPGLDGFGFLNICKKDSATKHIPVIVLTGRDSKEDMDEVRRLGALDCLVKYRVPSNLLREYIKTIFGE